MIWRVIALSFIIYHLSFSVAYAQDDKSMMFNPVEHAVISQTIAPDARSAGMGDVGAATDPDVNSQYWNPAKYPFCISRAGIALNYTPWLRQIVMISTWPTWLAIIVLAIILPSLVLFAISLWARYLPMMV